MRTTGALASMTVVGALLRFVTLGDQSYWGDEGVTVALVRMGFGDMLDTIPRSESTPPLYYALAWLWTRALGSSEEWGLRSLSALVGTVTIPVVYAAGAALVTRRAGLVAAALAACSPLLVWYSQESRAYALLALMTALTLWLFARALGGRRAALVACLPFLAVGAALLPLALDQRATGNTAYIADIDFAQRAKEIPKKFLVGEQASPGDYGSLIEALKWPAIALTFTAVGLLAARGDPRERSGGLIAAGLAAAGFAMPLVLKLAGLDYLAAYNLQMLWIPAATVAAAGFGARGARWIGLAAAAALCAIGVGVVVKVASDPDLQRYDYRELASLLQDPPTGRAIVATPLNSLTPLAAYLPAVDHLPPRTRVQEIVIVGMQSQDE